MDFTTLYMEWYCHFRKVRFIWFGVWIIKTIAVVFNLHSWMD